MLAIRNNLMAENASLAVAKNYKDLAKSVERLSSGLRIVRASDDAAGLAVRELMRVDVAVFAQAARNAQDGISMLQTAEGALGVVDECLIRMKELAEQAASGSYSNTQRTIMNAEFQQMASEVDRIATSTNFNGIRLLDSAGGSVRIHIGTGNSTSDYFDVGLVNVSKDELGLTGLSIANQDSAAASLAALTDAITTKDSARASFGYNINRLEAVVDVLNIQKENTLTSESRISDVDVAAEMADLTRRQVLTQAGTAMLSQANSMPQLAMTLLKG